MVQFCIEFMRKESMLMKGDIDNLEESAKKMVNRRGLEAWLESAKGVMRPRRYIIMKEEFGDKYRPDLGFLPVEEGDIDLSVTENILWY